VKAKSETYADLLVMEWGIDKCSPKLKRAMYNVLTELVAEAQLFLRRNPKLQVAVVDSEKHFSVWAYFPVHRRRLIAKAVQLKPSARVLLVISKPRVEKQPRKTTEAELRDHFGHVLLYLRDPKAHNDCPQALREWDRACQ
jgi:hypothetical protein